ncbi:hypothetical protein CO026_02270 [Candidatus Kaiserbacteria bacterium CG_4_9_14_0_2_um_filter_41_32]|uniref:Uncharacterized protein n=1 Tax=Candidatus Kaiserbacteria bacterium CG_4_9_14_0_2_um_filter_41_32 TaxID=1974601 RepID=A0A2M8FER6_9BACT|nr:MAG: hypothetical protein CO026_02270 [Candidatus Kaiserbacteria bacterium CG_4_9_14_0_2_um_filter_41_32]
MTDLKSHTFDNGDMLHLDVTDGYAGYHGLKVYTVSYLEQDSDPETGELIFNSNNGDSYMSEVAAMAGFDARLASADPLQSYKPDGGITHLVLDAFKKYLGEGTLRPMPTSQDWDGFAKHVLESTFGRHDTTYYDGEKICSTLEELESVSTSSTSGKADVMLEIPAWKMLEIMTAITALAMALKQLPSHSMFTKAA